jgi:nitrite reductase (NADH) small subunit
MADPASKVRVGAADAIPPGQGRCFLVGGEEVAVFRQRDGTLFATQNRCPHKNGPLAEGIVGGGKVICPFHSRKFDLRTGKNAEGDQVKVYAAREENGGIVVELQ